MTRTAEVAIVGGGIMGASIAYHLAKRGCTNVVVLEAAEMFGLGSTGLNAGGVRHQFSSITNIELSKLSFALMDRFEDAMDQPISLRRDGYLFLLDDAADLERFRANVALQNARGVPSRIVDVDEIARLAPEIVLDGIVGGAWCDRDGLVDPNGLLQGYLTNARRLGVATLEHCPATGITMSNGTFSIETPRETIEAPRVVIAAGAWSANVGRFLGIDIPIQPIRRQIAVVQPSEPIRKNFPFVIDFSRSLYFHREGTAILTGMSNNEEPPGWDTTVDEDWELHHLETAAERLPLVADAGIRASWAGLYEVTPDDQPILGAMPQMDGLYICAGFSGHGLMHGPAAGLVMAEEILGGRATTVDIDALRWSRFANGVSAAEYNVV